MRLRNLIGGMALSLFSLCAAPHAFAQTDPCAGPFPGPNVNIVKNGDCNVPAINVTGSVQITVTNGSLTTSSITAGGFINIAESGGTETLGALVANGPGEPSSYVAINGDSITGTTITSPSYLQVVANTGSISLGNITTNTTNLGGDILVVAQTSVKLGTVNSSSNGNYVGWLDIKAYQGGGTPAAFVIGGSGSNSIAGVVQHSQSTISPNGLYVTNGTATAVGDIQVASTSAISMTNTGNSTGTIILNANQGTITLPSGTISLDGTSSTNLGGVFYLMAQTISAPSGATLSASQPSTAPSSNHNVTIAATTIAYGGSGGFKMLANGNGGLLSAFPFGSIEVTDDENVSQSFTWSINVSGTQGALTFNGSGSPLVATANGDNTNVSIDGYPLVFNASSVALTAQGTTNHQINIGTDGATNTGSAGVNFNVTGATTLDASATASGNGGNVTIWDDQVSINGTTFAIKADGPSSGNGNGGTLSLLWSNTILNSATKASFSANGASATTGTGNGGSITYWPGSSAIAFGNAADQLSITARGGKSSGNGGSISISGGNMSFNGTQAGAMDVSVPGTTGNGGTLSVSGGTITFSGTGYKLSANAGSTQGNGGTISLNPFAAMTIGNSSGGVQLSAIGAGTGNGGSITAGGLPLKATAASINVSAGTATGSNGAGGKISLTSNFTFNNPWLTGNLVANGIGTGPGGTITINTDGGSFTGSTFTANGGVSGNGGSIGITTTSSTNADSISGTTTLTASGGATQGNGGSVSLNTAGSLTVAGANMVVAAGGNGNGGNLTLSSTPGPITITGGLAANGKGTGLGGIISITSVGTQTITLDGATLSASGDPNGSGSGNSVTISNGGGFSLNGTTIDVTGASSGSGGTISILTTAASGPPYLNLSSATLNADGGATGSGGSVTFNNVSPFAVQEHVFVESGDGTGGCCGVMAALATHDRQSAVTPQDTPTDGSIDSCKETSLSRSNWPKNYFDCTTAGGSNTAQEAAAIAVADAKPSIRTLLGTFDVQLYTFSTLSDAEAKFGLSQLDNPPTANSIGYTYAALGLPPPPGPSIYSLTYPPPGFVPQQLQETATHELGHAIDQANTKSGTLVSDDTTYKAFVNNDLINLDYSVIGSNDKTSTYRDPCAGANAPLANVLDATAGNTPYCTNGALTNPNKYGQLTNSGILALAEPDEFGVDKAGGFREMWAQSFAFVAYSNANVAQPKLLVHVTTDTFLSNAQTLLTANPNSPIMPCTLANANAIWAEKPYPPTNSSCSAGALGWYTPFGPKQH